MSYCVLNIGYLWRMTLPVPLIIMGIKHNCFLMSFIDLLEHFFFERYVWEAQ